MLGRLLKLLLPALVLGEVALIRLQLIDISSAIWAVVVLETALLLVGGRQVLVAWRRYRAGRAGGLDAWAALEDGFAVMFPRPVARVLALEPRVWWSLALWVSRRWRPGTGDFSYHRRSIVGPMLLVLLVTTPVELLLVELLVS